jgi:hypothetical protein
VAKDIISRTALGGKGSPNFSNLKDGEKGKKKRGGGNITLYLSFTHLLLYLYFPQKKGKGQEREGETGLPVSSEVTINSKVRR